MRRRALTSIEGGDSIQNMKRTMNLTELHEYLGIPKRTLYDMIQDGRFPVAPIKGLHPRRWNVEDVDAWRFSKEQEAQ